MSIPALILLVAQWQHDRPFIDQVHEAEHLRLEGKSTQAEGILRGAVNSGYGTIGERGTAANNLASLLARRGRHAEAERLWRRAIALWTEADGPNQPRAARAMNNLAADLASRKRYDEAAALYRQVLSTVELPEALNNLGVVHQQLGRYDEAESLFRRAIRKFGDSRGAMQPWGNLAILLERRERIDESLHAFDQVVALLPELRPADEKAAARYLAHHEALLRHIREPAGAERVGLLAMRFRVREARRNR
ncbi:MAG: tetratricopeptide repeat protein [Acidobacteria bacterium]|nr:tetratricopeptide repeat protein [Acidobacteriota bacterium]